MIVPDDLAPAGDLSDDSSRIGPVQAHVDAALVPQVTPYPLPLDALLTLGEPNTGDVEARRAALPRRWSAFYAIPLTPIRRSMAS